MKWVLHLIVMATATEKLGIIVTDRGVYTDNNENKKKFNLTLLCQCERAIADISVPINKNRKLAN